MYNVILTKRDVTRKSFYCFLRNREETLSCVRPVNFTDITVTDSSLFNHAPLLSSDTDSW